jgi:hypothetical protein
MQRTVGNLPNHARLRPQVVNWHLEESLDLRCVQVHGDNVVASCDLQHVGDELGGDGRTRLVFAILSFPNRQASLKYALDEYGRTIRE